MGGILIPRKKKVETEVVVEEGRTYKCLRCGKEYSSPAGKFFKATYSQLYIENSRYVPLCRQCVDELFDDFSRRYGSDRTACILLCYMMDIPFYHLLYDSIVTNNNKFSIGMYVRQLNGPQYRNQTFAQTILTKELEKTKEDVEKIKDDKWTAHEIRNKNEAIAIIGYDPFEGYDSEDRRFLFNELIKYFDEDIAEDPYKLSQIIQIVNNNNQIRKYDLRISAMNPSTNPQIIKDLNTMKASLVTSNDKIAKENEISVKNRSNKDIGKNTLTFLMRDLREKDFTKAEANYYDQLSSEGTQWAANMSLKAIKENTFFDENDQEEVFETQRQMIQDLSKELDDAKEKYRLAIIENQELKDKLGIGDKDG